MFILIKYVSRVVFGSEVALWLEKYKQNWSSSLPLILFSDPGASSGSLYGQLWKKIFFSGQTVELIISVIVFTCFLCLCFLFLFSFFPVDNLRGFNCFQQCITLYCTSMYHRDVLFMSELFSFPKRRKQCRHFKFSVLTVVQIEFSSSYNYYKLGGFLPPNLSRRKGRSPLWRHNVPHS